MATRKAFVLIQTQAGKSTEVVASLRKLKGVKEAHLVTGPHDVIASLEMEDLNKMTRLIGNKIHYIDGINRTLTYLVLDTPPTTWEHSVPSL
jgi:DNA-binding Lrp family transcriptional regulator